MSVFGTMGELASMYLLAPQSFRPFTHISRVPTAGGQYHWVSILAPRSQRKFLSYIIGKSRFDRALSATVQSGLELLHHLLRLRQDSPM